MIAWLDRQLGRVTMYVLVIVWLTVLGAAALVLTFIPGAVSFSPLALLASASVLLVVSYLTNGVAGIVFRTRPQLSSTVITALLLLFIFTPSIDVLPLVGLALAAFLAVVTKYLLAWRGRHIFNPAAAAAFIVGMPGLPFGFATWWVGTTPLVPIAAIAALTILFRTRRLWLGGAYLATVLVVWQIRGLMTGTAGLDSLTLPLLSLPTVFFAGFMLSEPLTLPPRRWQQLAEAVLVGLISSIAFTFGPLYSSPQLALLIGNLLAFLVGQRRGIRLRLVARRALTPTSWDYAFEPLAPVRYRPGQYMELTLPHSGTDARGWRRVFSIVGAPDSGELRFGVRMPDRPSSFKAALQELEPGTIVSATSVSGDFLLPRDPSQKLLLLAGGIGITPFVGQLLAAAAETPRRDIVVVTAISSAAEFAYRPELEAAGFPVVVVSPDEPLGMPSSWTWVEAPQLTPAVVHAQVPDARDRVAYVSGSPALVAELKRALRGSGVRRVRTDTFLGY
jgi:glycine betaine catabolism B